MLAKRGRATRMMDGAVVGGLALLVLLLVGAQAVNDTGLTPAFELLRSTEGSASSWSDLELRGTLMPVLQADLGAPGERPPDEGNLRPRPVTASLWLAPIGSLYTGAGVNWSQIAYPDGTVLSPALKGGRQEFRIHLGGGLMAPLTPSVGLDVRGGS